MNHWIRAALFLGILGLTACDGCGEKDADNTQVSADGGVGTDAGQDAEAAEVAPLTPADVQPVFRALPASDVVPTSVEIEFARPLINDAPHVAGANTEAKLVPETPGVFKFKSNSTLVFTPEKPLSPSTTYRVEVASVESVDGALRPEQPWTYEFTTPDFGLVNLSGAVLDQKTKALFADIVFSAELQPAELKPFASFDLDGVALTNVTYDRGYASNVVRMTAKSATTASTGTLRMKLKAGVADIMGNKAAAGDVQTSFRTGAPVNLLAATRKEGPSGFYIELVCNDTSAPGGTRWYWDRQNYQDYRVSRRCLPTAESLKSAITLSPEVPNLKVGSGEGGFNLIGDFSRGSYTLRIDAGMTTVDGGVLSQTFTQTVMIPTRTASLSFADKGRYVPQSKWKSLQLTHLNTPSVEVLIRHIPRENIVFWLSGEAEAADERVSNVVAKESITFEQKVDEPQTSTIDITSILGKTKPGVYEVTVKAGAASDSVRLLVTDMNVVVKRSEQAPGEDWSREAFAWVVDMTTNKPVVDAAVSVIRKSGQSLAACKTDKTGGCRLELPQKSIDPNPPFAILVSRGEEFTFLEFDDLKVTPADARVHGEAYLSEAPYRAAFWGDRDLYRPGETAHIVATFRDEKFSAPAKALPVEVQIRDSRSQQVRREALTTNAAGIIEIEHTLNDFAATGTYVAEFKVAKRLVGRYDFKVEEFVPERMKVEVVSPAKDALLAQIPPFDVTATYLFGGSAEDSPVELTCRVESAPFAPKSMPEFRFGPASQVGQKLDLGTTTAQLDSEGMARIACPEAAAGASLAGPSELVAQAAVFEAGSGRTTVADARVQLHPARHYVGLKTGNTSVEVGKKAVVEGVVVDWDGKVTTDVAEVIVAFMRLEREYWWYSDDDDGASNWGQNIRPVEESEAKVAVKDGKFRLEYTPTEYAAGYVVRASVSDNIGTAATELRFDSSRSYGWYYWDDNRPDRSATPKPTRPTTLAMTAPDAVEVGKDNTVSFNVPFKGRLLTTMETNRVETYEWHDVEPGEFTWKFKVATFAPNVYVSGLLVKDPGLDGAEAFSPDRALGVESIRVLPTDHVLEVALKTPETVEPHQTLNVNVKVGKTSDTAFVTVAAVDEGILQLTRFKTPNLEKQLFAKRRLGVDTFETIGWAMRLRSGAPGGRTGGGDDYDEEEASADGPGRAMAVKPVALWSGVVPVNKDGTADVKFEIPTYRGALRVMAVAVSGDRTGAAESKVVVRDPLVLQTTLPRFLSASDKAQVPVFVTNMTGKAADVTVRLTVDEVEEPGLGGFPRESALALIQNGDTKVVKLEAGKSGTVVFVVQALRQSGVARLRVDATAGKVASWDEGIVPMRPSGSLVRQSQQIELSAGTTTLTSALGGWVPTSERSTIWVTSVPYGKSFDHLKYLVRYPYGCIEQTTSSTRPLLYMSQFVPMIDPEAVSKAGSIEAMVKSGIDRVFSMQTSDGGFGYWPGESSSPWGTAYATHMLLDARDQGFDVPEQRLNDAIAYLETEVENISSGRSPEWHKDTEPYMHFVLARAGKPKKALALRYAESLPPNPEGEVAEHAYMTWAALYLAGDRRFEKQLKNVDVSALETKRGNRWTFYSDARRRGMVLSIFFDLFKNAPEGEPLAAIIGKYLAQKPSYHYTTQELTWGITGLGKWIQGTASKFGVPTLVANGKTLKPTIEPKAGNDRTWSLYRASEYGTIDVKIDKADGKVYAVISSEGVRSGEPPRVGGQGLLVQRTFRKLDGTELGVDDHRLGDLIYTEVTIKNRTGRELSNLALVDRFAGGFEVENPKLGRGQLPDWVNADEVWNVDHMNVRDDRIEAFGTLRAGAEVKLIYAVRAVTAGQFQAPGPSIEGMYEPEVWAAEAPARIEVQGPWAAYIN
ncbi:MAG: MG2 domain-containing protein [bacterium]